MIIAMIGKIANFERPAQLKSYFGLAPTLTQSGKTLELAKLSPRGVRLMKTTIYLVVWQVIRHPDNEFACIYEQLVPRKCVYDERRKKYVGTGKIIGRIAGQLIGVIFKLLKQDQELVLNHAIPPDPQLYDPLLHQQHRAGHYHSPVPIKQEKIIELPSR